MGFTNLMIWDFDTVAPENLGPQGFLPSQIGMLKTDAVIETCKTINPDCNIKAFGRFEPGTEFPEKPVILIAAVDSMACRADIYTACPDWSWFLDNRMGPAQCTLYALQPSDSPRAEKYNSKDISFSDAEASPLPCTSRSTAYGANLSAALTLATIRDIITNPDNPEYIPFGTTINLSHRTATVCEVVGGIV